MRTLWVKRTVPDNYIHPWFLSQLKRNEVVANYQYKKLLSDFSVLLLNMCNSVIFVLSFVAIYARNMKPQYFSLTAVILDILMAAKLFSEKSEAEALAALKSLSITVFSVMVLTPVFRSLTESTSSDSIWTLCGWLLVVNLLFCSRSLNPISINTSLAATIMLASRLTTSVDVFYFIMYNLQTFISVPAFYMWLRKNREMSAYNYALLDLTSLVSTILVSWLLGSSVLYIWILIQALVLFAVPRLFLALQRYKDRISGPWDAAVPILS